MNYRGDFCFFLTTDHRYALASPHWPFLRKLGHREQKNRKCRWAEKILGVEYRSASNFGTHRDKCFVGWNRAFLTIRPHGRHVFPTTFWAEQETWDALPLIFCLFPTKRRLSETLHTSHIKFLVRRLEKLVERPGIFCSGAAILIFILLPANHDFAPG